MSAIIDINRVTTGSDYDFWKINLPIQEGPCKRFSSASINILSQAADAMLSQARSSSQSILKQVQ